jgi:ABC-type multidrug transport system fused ATPase/permease subunit
LDAGQIIENGEPWTLLKDPKSHFSKLYASAMSTDESD